MRIEDWRSVAELELIVKQIAEEDPEEVELDAVEATSVRLTDVMQVARQITVASRQDGKIRFEIILKGDINSIDAQVQKTLEAIFKSLSGNTITITDVQAGCIKITLQGSPGDVAKLIDQITSGELTEIYGFPVEDTQL